MIPMNDLRRSVTGEYATQLATKTVQVVTSGTYILGNEVQNFETEFASYLGAGFVTSVASGTDALVIALRSLGVVRGSRVLLTPNAGGYTTSALFEIGGKPVFVDCDDMGRIDIESLGIRLASTPQAVCLVVTHLYGLNSNIEEALEVCRLNGVKILEDCAQAAGAHVGGKKLGTFGDAATFSFYPTKNLGSLGDSGAIATTSSELASVHRALRQYGWSSRYQVDVPYGRNSRMDELQAGVLRLRLPMLDDLNLRRKQIWNAYHSSLSDSGWRIIGKTSSDFVAHLGVIVSPRKLRDRARTYLESRGIATSIHYPKLDYQQPGWSSFLDGNCPFAEDLTQRIFSIPLFPELSDNEVHQVTEALRGMTLELPHGI